MPWPRRDGAGTDTENHEGSTRTRPSPWRARSARSWSACSRRRSRRSRSSVPSASAPSGKRRRASRPSLGAPRARGSRRGGRNWRTRRRPPARPPRTARRAACGSGPPPPPTRRRRPAGLRCREVVPRRRLPRPSRRSSRRSPSSPGRCGRCGRCARPTCCRTRTTTETAFAPGESIRVPRLHGRCSDAPRPLGRRRGDARGSGCPRPPLLQPLLWPTTTRCSCRTSWRDRSA